MAQDNAVFTEVLELQVQSGEFEAGLQKIKETYLQFVADLNSQGLSGNDVLNIGSIGQISEQLNKATELVNTFIKGTAENLNQLTAGVTDALDAIATKAEQAAGEMDESLSAHVKSSEQKVQEALAGITEGLKNQTSVATLSYQEQYDVFNRVQELIQERGTVVLENLTSANRKWFDAQLQTYAGLEEADARRQLKRVEEEQAAVEKMGRLEEQAYAENARRIEQAQAQTQRMGKAMAQAHEENAQRSAGAWQKFLSGFTGKSVVELTADNSKSAWSGFFSSIMTEFPQMLGQVARFQILWGLVGAAIHLAQAAFEAVVAAFKEGFEYLNHLQEKADELQGVIAANVTFSKDLKENFLLAGEAAEQVVRSLRDISFKDHVDPDQLNSAFKALAEGGGAQFVTSLQQMVSLTELFTLAMKASGKETQVTRSLITEIPALLDGSISKNSKLLEVLHLNKDQWEQIREKALQHHDLLNELEPILRPYLDATQQAALHQSVLNEQMTEFKKEIEAAIAKPLWDAWTELLRSARDYFIAHKEQIMAIITQMGRVIAQAGQLAGQLLHIGILLQGINNYIAGAAALLAIVLTTQSLVLTGYELLFKSGEAVINQLIHPSKWFNKEEWKKTFDQIVALGHQAAEDAQEASNKLYTALTGQPTEMPKDYNVKGGTSPRDNSTDQTKKDLADLQRQYSDLFKQIHDGWANTRTDTQNAIKTGAVEAKEGERELAVMFQMERDEIQKAVGAYKTKAAVIIAGAKKQKEIQAESIQSARFASAEIRKIREQEFNGVSKAKTEIDLLTQREDRQHQQILLKQAAEQAKNELEVMKANANQKHTLKSDLLAKDQEVADKEYLVQHAALMAELADAQQNVLKRTTVQAQLDALDKKYTADTKSRTAERTKAAHDEQMATLQGEKERLQRLATLHEQEIQLDEKKNGNAQKTRALEKELLKDRIAVINVTIQEMQTELAYLQSLQEEDPANEGLAESIDKVTTSINEQIQARDQMTKQIGSQDKGSGSSLWKIFGADDFDDFKSKMGDTESAFNTLSKGLQNVKGIISGVMQGFKQGGLLGGLGAGLSQVGGMVGGPWGAVMGFAGSVMGMLGSLFTKAAQKIGEEIKKAISDTMTQFQNGQATLKDTIAKLEQERNDAITRLSGKKGGKDQLNQILPQLDQDIASLKKQQQDLISGFEQQLQVLNLHSDTLGQFLATWQQINKQVKDYLDAGGDVAKATQFLNDQLQQLKENAQNNLAQGEQQAIQDALQLNGLIQQRVDLIKQEAAAEFDIMNKDAVEKRVSPAIAVATALQQQRGQFQTQLDSLTQQIDLTSQKVAKEKEVFQIASDTAALQKQAAELELQQLDQELSKYRDMQQLVAGIVTTANGNLGISDILQKLLGIFVPATQGNTGTGNLGGLLGGLGGGGRLPPGLLARLSQGNGAQTAMLNTGDINISVSGVTGNPQQIGTTIADSLMSELQKRGRYGLGMQFA